MSSARRAVASGSSITCTVVFLAVIFVSRVVSGQSNGEKVYAKVAPSVFLVQVRGVDGNPISQGTAFVAARGRLVTNAHVVEDGRAFVIVGGLAVECKI